MADQVKNQAAVMDKQPDQKDLSTADLARASAPAKPAATNAPAATAMDHVNQPSPLLPGKEAETFHSRWNDIQAGFVDEPRRSVEQADNLVAEVMKELATTFANERQNLENQWNSGNNVSTEDLRQALRRYRSFFDRLLNV